MNWWKKLLNRFKRYEEWIEIKVPENFKKIEDSFFNDEDEISQDIDEDEIRREEE